MNTPEFEQRMKGLLEEQEYQPDNAAWDKMQQALQPPASRKLLFLFPAWKAAAAVAGLLMLGGGAGYLWKGSRQSNTPQVAVAPSAETKTPASQLISEPELPARAEEIVAGMPPANRKNQQIFTGHTSVGTYDTIMVPAAGPAPAQPAAKDAVIASGAAETAPGPKNTPVLTRPTYSPDTYFADPFAPQHTNSLNMGIAANVGKPSLGNVQYNIGVVVRQDLGSHLFAEANVSLASTNVNYAENVYGYTSNSLTNEGYLDSRQEVTMRYTNNIVSLGFAPSIGVKATRNLSVSVGGDIYKSLNSGLIVQNKTDLDEFAVAPEVTNKGTSAWDAGLRAQLDYKLGRKFSVSTQYRHGLTQFILVDKQTYKNSVFNIGLRYYIGH